MCSIQNSSGSDSIREAFLEAGSFRNSTENESSKKLVNQANSISILDVIATYGIKIDDFNLKCKCPFVSHKNGNERTPSFTIFKEKNTFYCFGCNTGGTACKFVSLIDNISVNEAAEKILDRFDIESLSQFTNIESDFSLEKNILSLEFSTAIRNFLLANIDDTDAFEFSEKITKKFDSLFSKHKITSDGIRSIHKKLCEALQKYKCQQQ